MLRVWDYHAPNGQRIKYIYLHDYCETLREHYLRCIDLSTVFCRADTSRERTYGVSLPEWGNPIVQNNNAARLAITWLHEFRYIEYLEDEIDLDRAVKLCLRDSSIEIELDEMDRFLQIFAKMKRRVKCLVMEAVIGETFDRDKWLISAERNYEVYLWKSLATILDFIEHQVVASSEMNLLVEERLRLYSFKKYLKWTGLQDKIKVTHYKSDKNIPVQWSSNGRLIMKTDRVYKRRAFTTFEVFTLVTVSNELNVRELEDAEEEVDDHEIEVNRAVDTIFDDEVLEEYEEESEELTEENMDVTCVGSVAAGSVNAEAAAAFRSEQEALISKTALREIVNSEIGPEGSVIDKKFREFTTDAAAAAAADAVVYVRLDEGLGERHFFPAHTGDAGLDLCAAELVTKEGAVITVEPNERCVLSTGVSFSVPYGYHAEIVNRYWTGSQGLILGSSMLDPTYNEPLVLNYWNVSKNKLTLTAREARMAQIVFYGQKTPDVQILSAEDFAKVCQVRFEQYVAGLKKSGYVGSVIKRPVGIKVVNPEPALPQEFSGHRNIRMYSCVRDMCD